MSVQDEREAIASLLMEHVKNEDTTKVESQLGQFSQDSQWRQIVRCEFPLSEMLESTLRYDVVIPRLLSYEIRTISPFHYAAFKGLTDILVNFVDHDVPVDVTLASGTTALHLAAFGGTTDCVALLVDVYKADLNKQDKYGWTALHYASTEGQLEVVKVLVKAGIDTNLRDQDGTTAAFRAQANGFEEVADCLCEEEDDSLNVDPAYEGKPPLAPEEGLYSKVRRVKSVTEMSKVSTSEQNSSMVRDRAGKSKAIRRAQSAVITSAPVFKEKSPTVPEKFAEKRTATIRRMIRKQFEDVMDSDTTDPAYMHPVEYDNKKDEIEDDEKLALAGVGVNTLKGIMRDEISRITKQLRTPSDSPDNGYNSLPDMFSSSSQMPKSNVDYEDIYETVKGLDHIIEDAENEGSDVPEEAPPLPPRNLDMFRPITVTDKPKSTSEDNSPANRLVLKRTEAIQATESMALKESIKRLAPIIGPEWKKLAHALPLEPNKQKVEARVAAISARHPGDNEKQASIALAEWRINRGQAADIDDLVLALRKCGLTTLIEQVERVSQEFTA